MSQTGWKSPFWARFNSIRGFGLARSSYLFTSESVSEGHPDKVCDRISDEIVDLVFREAKKVGMDPAQVRIACETLATTNRVVIAGEVRVPDSLLKGANNEKLVRHVRAINPTAKIISTADMLRDVQDIYAAGADYVTVTRLSDAHTLFEVIDAADQGLLEAKRAEMDAQLAERREVLP